MTRRPRLRHSASLAAFFEAQVKAGEAAQFCLPGARPLIRAGEPAAHLYFLRTGRLGVEFGGADHRIAAVHPGETVGGMAVIAGAAHLNNIFALRDCELYSLPRADFIRCIQADPNLLVELSRVMLRRRNANPRADPALPRRVFGVVALTAAVSAREMAEALADALVSSGHAAIAVDPAPGPVNPEWFARLEAEHDFVLYAVEHDEPGWRTAVARQADALLYLARGVDRPRPQPRRPARTPWSPQADLILLQNPDFGRPRGADAWASALSPGRLHHVRPGRTSDIERVARFMAGRAVGLVLSGGAARAYAHLGAVKALREAGVPIDAVAGVSMGAIIGAGVAIGWDDDELRERVHRAFVISNPAGDLTWPFVAISRGEQVRQRLAEHFTDRTISDLWAPFFCVSTNLTTGEQQVHRRGLVRDALRASLSVPGLFPPVTRGGEVLVDGAVLNNFPADIMRTVHSGPIVGVDVGSGRSIGAADVKGPRSAWNWIVSGAWRAGAPIISILIRSATLTAQHQLLAAHEVTDVLIQPKLDHIEIGDWRAFEPAATEGYRATQEVLSALPAPIAELRGKTSEAA